MQINAQFDLSALRSRTLREAKNLAYSTSQAINATVKDVQTAERIHMDQTYHLRRAGFMYRLIKISQFSNARQGIPFAEIMVDRKTRVLLSTFEEGGLREPAKGKSVAVPITGGEARPTQSATIPDQFTFRKMKFQRHVTATGKTQWKGANGTFLIPNVGVFKRTDKGPKTGERRKSFIVWRQGGRVLHESKLVKLLYKLMAPGAMKRLPANLHLHQIATEQMQQKFGAYFNSYYNKYKN